MAKWLKCKNGYFNSDYIAAIIAQADPPASPEVKYHVVALLPDGRVHIDVADLTDIQAANALVEKLKGEIENGS